MLIKSASSGCLSLKSIGCLAILLATFNIEISPGLAADLTPSQNRLLEAPSSGAETSTTAALPTDQASVEIAPLSLTAPPQKRSNSVKGPLSQSLADLPAASPAREILLSQANSTPTPKPSANPNSPVGKPEVYLQAAYLQQGGDLAARLRARGIYTLSPTVFAGATVDLTTGNAFSDTAGTGLSLNELYITASPANLPQLRFTAGLMDLTSYFDRNSFAKDAVTHFFNPLFQTNPALSAVNLSSRPGALVNWTPTDAVSLTAAVFSSSRSLSSFALDAFAGEVGVRFDNAIVRGTYITGRDAGYNSGFQSIFDVPRPDGTGLGPRSGDREDAFGLNAEYFIPDIKLGLFARYGWYNNRDLAEGGSTYSFGANALDLFLPDDRLGLAYGRQLANASTQASGRPTPDVLELFYDLRLSPNLRAGVSWQERNAFTETVLGLRLRYDLGWNDIRRIVE